MQIVEMKRDLLTWNYTVRIRMSIWDILDGLLEALRQLIVSGNLYSPPPLLAKKKA